jgi:uncharacterized protein YjbI with pentapeptide repeats
MVDEQGVELKGAQREGAQLKGRQLGSLRVVKLPRRLKVAMRRSGARGRAAWELERGGLAGKLMVDNEQGVELKGAQLKGAQLKGRQLWSFRVVKLPRTFMERVCVDGGSGRFARGSSHVWLQSAEAR